MIESVPLHRDAPAKPTVGEACNGCGVCCALEPCPMARIFLARGKGPCVALHWQDGERRYRCGLIAAPARHLPWLPRTWEAWVGRRFARWMAAGKGCDCDAAVVDQPLGT